MCLQLGTFIKQCALINQTLRYVRDFHVVFEWLDSKPAASPELCMQGYKVWDHSANTDLNFIPSLPKAMWMAAHRDTKPVDSGPDIQAHSTDTCEPTKEVLGDHKHSHASA